MGAFASHTGTETGAIADGIRGCGCSEVRRADGWSDRKKVEAMSEATFAKRKSAPVAVAQAPASDLRIGDPNDAFEQEADRVAEEVMSGRPVKSTWSLLNMSIGPPLQRKCNCGGSGGSTGECEECKEIRTLQRKTSCLSPADTAPAIVHEVVRSSGEPLDSRTKTLMEHRFGQDFSQVRIHADAKAAESARAVNAFAYDVGRHIAFASGHYRPETRKGQQLIAHELAHYVQQGHTPYRNLHVGASDSAEREAEQASHSEIAAKRVVARRDQNGRVARQSAGQAVDVPGPIVKPEEDPFKDVGVSTPYGRSKSGAQSTWGWDSPETNNLYHECNVAPLEREQFKKFVKSLPPIPSRGRQKPPKAEEVLGITSFNPGNAKPPEITTTAVQDGGKTVYKLNPTHAEMPPIRSAYTKEGGYDEGVVHNDTPECKEERIEANRKTGTSALPIHWTLTPDGAKLCKQAELEHCNDIRAAFDLTLGLYASAINNLAASERTYSKADEAVKDATRAAGVAPDMMIYRFNDMALKTRLRDDSEWHTATPIGDRNKKDEPRKEGCKYFFTIDGTSWPQVGPHDSSEVMGMTKAAKPPKGSKP